MPNLLRPQAVCKSAISSCVFNAMWCSAIGLHASLRPCLKHAALEAQHSVCMARGQQLMVPTTSTRLYRSCCHARQPACDAVQYRLPVLRIAHLHVSCMSDRLASLVKIFLRHICILSCTLGFMPVLRSSPGFVPVLRCTLGFIPVLRCTLGFIPVLRCTLGFIPVLRCTLGFILVLRCTVGFIPGLRCNRNTCVCTPCSTQRL